MSTIVDGTSIRDRPSLSATAFVGRQQELGVLAEALAAPAAVVLIDGEAGVGKSRLLREFLASVDGALVAGCSPVPEPYTLGPLVDALRQATDRVAGLRLTNLAGALRPLFPEWDADLPPMPEPAEDATASRHRVFRALAELLAGLDVRVLVVEDVHWADDATLEFLLYLARRDVSRPGLVITYRAEDLPADSLLLSLSARLPNGAVRLGLAPLTLDETATLVSSMLAHDRISAGFAAFVHEHTEGLPLAVEESVRLMHDRGDLVRRGNRWARRHLDRIDVPPSVRDAVLERARRLGPDTWMLLGAAAVLVDPRPPEVLAEVSELPTERATAAMVEALGAGLLVESARGLVSYRHMLAGRAIYEALPAPVRRAMHGRAGRALAGPPAQLARHFREAGDTAEWLRHGEQAADAALASGDEATAASMLSDLIINAGLPARSVARLAKKLPHVAFIARSRYRDLAAALRQLLDAGISAVDETADIRVQLGRMLLFMEDWTAGRAELERAIPFLTHDPVETVRSMMLLATPRGSTLPASTHLEWLHRAAEQAASLSPADRVGFLVERATVLLTLGEEAGWADAAKLPGEPPTALERQQVARGYLNIGEAAMFWGRYDDARRRLAKGLELADCYQYRRIHDEILVHQSHLAWFTGAWSELTANAGSLAAEDDIHPVTRLEAVLVTSLLHAATGSRATAGERLRHVLEELQHRRELTYLVEPAAALAKLQLADGRVEDALRVTDEPVELIGSQGLWLFGTEVVPVRTQALAVAGRTDDAARLVAAFEGWLHGRRIPAAHAALALCRALLAEAFGDGHAAEMFGAAAAAWQALPRPYDAALAYERQGVSLLACGDGSGAARLSEALSALIELGASADADRVAHTLRRHGVNVPRAWRGGRRGYGDQLSPRELEVVRLVATGRTNREIARALSRSPDTVASQLKSAMRKLGTSSRTALTARVIEAGLVEEH